MGISRDNRTPQEKIVMLRNVESHRKREDMNMSYIGSLKKAIPLILQDLSRTVNDKIFWGWD